MNNKNSQLVTTQNQLTTAQTQLRDKEGQLTITMGQLEELRGLFSDLQIKSNNKDNEINNLKEELGKSQNIDLRYKERKLDELIRNLRLDQQKERIDNLRDAYKRLKRSSEPENYNRDNINAAQTEIDTIKRELFQNNTEINVNDLHKVYKACEKVAELRVKQEKLSEQQFEARQVVVPYNNN